MDAELNDNPNVGHTQGSEYDDEDDDERYDSDMEADHDFLIYCRNNWRNMENMVQCLNCDESYGFYEEECESCGEKMTSVRFGECYDCWAGVQGAHGPCTRCEGYVEPFGH